MSNNKNRSLIRRPTSSVERAEPRRKQVLAGMVADTLAIAEKCQRARPAIVLVNDEPNGLRVMKPQLSHGNEG